MLKAGALLYAIFISFLISTISGFIIIAAYHYNLYVDNTLIYQQLISNSKSAINVFLEKPDLVPLNSSKEINLFDDGFSKVKLEHYSWGMYSVVTSTAKWKYLSFSKKYLLGDNILHDEKVALYLADKKNYLSLGGKTLIKGNCYLPELGIKRAYIEGKSFSGKQFVDGTIKKSEKKIPEINKELIALNKKYLLLEITANDSLINEEVFLESDTLINSFNNKTVVVKLSDDYQIDNKVLIGNVKILSKHKILISDNNKISDVIFYAKEIEIEDYFYGNLQLFSDNKIIINQNSTLEYPSNICLISNSDFKDSKIEINKNSEIHGSVILYSNNISKDNSSILKIANNSLVCGQIYSNDMLEHRGTIYGSLYINKLILITSSSVYENHLLDATIDVTKLSEYYAGVNLFGDVKAKKTIKCLN